MGNLSNSLTQEKVRVSLRPEMLEANLIRLISFDLDFSENEEYFREDTLSLGYENEAERVVKEYLAENKVTNKKELFYCCSDLLSMVFDSSFYGDWTLDVVETSNENEFLVFYSYVS